MKKSHSDSEIARVATLFFILRGLIRSRLLTGNGVEPYAWLRIETLTYVRDQKAPSMSDIAQYFSITAPSATSLINALVKSGLVTRTVDARDKRASRISLTKEGRRMLAETQKRGLEVLGGLFAPLAKPELRAFTGALERIIRAGK